MKKERMVCLTKKHWQKERKEGRNAGMRLLALLLAVVLLAGSLGGCGQSGEKGTNGERTGAKGEGGAQYQPKDGEGTQSQTASESDIAASESGGESLTTEEAGLQQSNGSSDSADRAADGEGGLELFDDMSGDMSGDTMPFSTEEYQALEEKGFSKTSVSPLSTFSADVDTASYSNLRRMLKQGMRPEEIPQGAVRLEEMLNYFHYDYQAPKAGEPFGVTIDAAPCPWNKEHGLIRIGIKTEEIDFSESPKSNLVFLLDVSGSMEEPQKLPLLKQAFAMLVESLDEKDRISIVTYAGTDEIVLDGARGNEKGEILEALQGLSASGSTNGSAGLKTAYQLAQEHWIEGGNNRIILATDGDLNVGQTSESELKTLVEEKRQSGVYLTVLGFGQGNIKDNKMETLADWGNGNYAYIDSDLEARRVLVEELGSTLVTVAEDVKLQLEFNPAQIAQYRLLGYENRLLAAEDFTDDTKDAGEIGAGHTVTALYEIVWADPAQEEEAQLKYQQKQPVEGEAQKEWATLKIRYKEPGASKSRELARAFGEEIYQQDLSQSDLLLAASVAEFALLLSDSDYKGEGSYQQILDLWRDQQYGGNEEISEFLELVQLAQGIVIEEGEEQTIQLKVLPETVTPQGAVFLLSNPFPEECSYGEELMMEQWRDGAWTALEMKEDVGWPDLANLLEPQTQRRLKLSWEALYGSLESGKYRVKKSVFREKRAAGSDRNEEYVVYGEFELGEETHSAEAEREEDDSQRPPAVELLTTNGDQKNCTYATLGTYEWGFPHGSQTESVIACSDAPTQWEEIATIRQEQTDGRITLGLSRNMVEYSICYWIEGATCGVADPVTMEGDAILLDDELGKGTYELYVKYLEGEAYYGFRVE